MTDHTALAPCPFCGGVTILVEKTMYGHGHTASCDDCSAMVVSTAEPPIDSERDVIAAWNSRAPHVGMVSDIDLCPVCAEPFKAGDTCATDIELGECHAECLEGSPIVYLDTGEPSDGPITTYPYEPDLQAARLERLCHAVEGECDGLAITNEQAATILAYVDEAALSSQQAEAEPVAWAQSDVERENEAFHTWWNDRGYDDFPTLYTLTCQNAMHAAWQEAAKRSALAHLSPPTSAVPAYAEPGVLEWIDGHPTKPWANEWFIAETTYGRRVVLRALPDGWTYDFTTADDTLIKADRIKRWMQFPDSEFKPAPSDRSALVPKRQAPDAWPQPKVVNPDIANPTGVPYLDCLLHRLLDAQQDINLEANERMSQSLCDASAIIDEVERCLRKFAATSQAKGDPVGQEGDDDGRQCPRQVQFSAREMTRECEHGVYNAGTCPYCTDQSEASNG